MDAFNSLLFILTTIAPSTPPGSNPVTYTPPPEWNTKVSPTENFENAFIPSTSDLPLRTKWNCPPNTHYEPCGSICVPACYKYICPVIDFCLEGCFCDKGYVRGRNGTCVKESECFVNPGALESNQIEDSLSRYPKECGPDEYMGCDSQCQRNCSNYQDDIRCPRNCVLDCVCLPPKIRGPDGSCILPEQCFSTPPAHMDKEMKDWTSIFHLLRIMNQEAPGCSLKVKQCDNPDECSNDDDENDFPIEIQVDDVSKPCFPNLKPRGRMQCPAGEHYKECGDVCIGTCIDYHCPAKCCVEGCFCEEGYVRGPYGKCIPKDQCPNAFDHSLTNQDKESYAPSATGCRPYEIISCYSRCQRNCSNYFNTLIPCPEVCVMGCICYPPMIRAPDGDCILPDQCPATALQRDVEEDMQKAALVHNFHRIMESSQDAPSTEEKQCYPPHRCPEQSEENYIPSTQGQLWRCPRKNEFLNLCIPACPNTCDNYKDQSQACKKICLPIPKCDCKDGFVRAPNGDCITPEECPDQNKTYECSEFEYYDSCGTACEDDCTTYMKPDKTCDKSCKAGCFCRPGFIRGPDGRCILPVECAIRSSQHSAGHFDRLGSLNSVCPENEEWQSCGTACPKNCTNYDQDFPCIAVCREGCFCKEPRVRGPDGTCILIEECPLRLSASETCPEHEEWQSCGTACPKDCTNYDIKISCIAVCREGCFCEEPRVRGPDGTCILIEECPLRSMASETCPEHEEWQSCGTACPKDCTNYDIEISCIAVCREGCFCEEPRVRGPDGTCILIEECPLRSMVEPVGTLACSENEYYDDCGPLCPRNCSNYDRDISCSYMCMPGCFCKSPLVRGPDGECIAVEECPSQTNEIGKEDAEDSLSQFPPFLCKKNERFTPCKSICPDTCSNYKEDRYCKRMCLPGCACLPGYVISRNGDCVKKEDCAEEDRPQDCAEMETYEECGSYCEPDCFNYSKGDRDCDIKGCKKGCFCRPGWVRSPDMKCIPPYQCPK